MYTQVLLLTPPGIEEGFKTYRLQVVRDRIVVPLRTREPAVVTIPLPDSTLPHQPILGVEKAYSEGWLG